MFHSAEEVGVFAGMEDETTQYIELHTDRDASKKRSPRVVTNEADIITSAHDNDEAHTEDTEGTICAICFLSQRTRPGTVVANVQVLKSLRFLIFIE